MTTVNLADKLDRFSSHWQPQIVTACRGNDSMVVRVPDTFTRHRLAKASL